MKPFFIVANLKANLTVTEGENWIKIFSQKYIASKYIKVIIAPSYLDISNFHHSLKNLENVSLSSQDVSVFGPGAHTGEVPVANLSHYCQYAIVGHSERRSMQYQNTTYHVENNVVVAKKISNCEEVFVTPIVCFSRFDQITNIECDNCLFAFEPPQSIGSGSFASVESVKKMAQSSSVIAKNRFLYGGSVDEDNIQSYISQDFINGVILATSAKNVEHFLMLLERAGKYLSQFQT